LGGKPVTAILSCNGARVAIHRFDSAGGPDVTRRDSLQEGDWPDEQQAHPGSGGARPNTGRRAKTTDAGRVRNYPASLDKTSWKILLAYGDGELSEGIRRAAQNLPTLAALDGGKRPLPEAISTPQ